MTDLSAFSVARKWPAKHPDRLQLYWLSTPNGVKVSILLEECGLPNEAHRVSFETNDQFSPDCIATFPNNVPRALAAFVARPAVQRGLLVPQRTLGS